MPIFYNSDIYPNERDYIIGGFYANEGEKITKGYIKTCLRERLENLINKKVTESMAANSLDGLLRNRSETTTVVLDDLSTQLSCEAEWGEAYSDSSPQSQIDLFVDMMMNNWKVASWVGEVALNIDNVSEDAYYTHHGQGIQVQKNMGKNPSRESMAMKACDESTIDDVIVALNSIV